MRWKWSRQVFFCALLGDLAKKQKMRAAIKRMVSLITVCLAFTCLFGKGFWEEKPYPGWTPQEVTTILTKSPWAAIQEAFFVFPGFDSGEPIITLAEKEVRFVCRLDSHTKIEKKFKLKNMLFKGHLEI